MKNIFMRFREHSGMTQIELADRMKLSQAAVSYLERGLRIPSPGTVVDFIGVAAIHGQSYTFDDVYENMLHGAVNKRRIRNN